MLEILSVHDTTGYWIFKPDTIEDIYRKLEVEHDTRPDFEDYGNHINHNPKWLNPEAEEKYKGCTMIFSSPYVRLITDDKEIISRCEKAINGYKETDQYKQARRKYLELKAEQEKAYKESINRLMKQGKIA
jgi:hypothetical protein